MESTPVKLKGYQVTEEIYHGSRTIVKRAIRTSDQKPVVLKLLKNSYPSFSELVQFRNQYTITKNLQIPGILTPLALEKYGNGYMLVMADEGYQSLPSSLNYPLSLDKFFPIALQLTAILEDLYQNRIIHKDIKPVNILIHPCTGIVQIIDFSISSLLTKEMQQGQNPNVLEGTLAYMSPEQTGRMNRCMDYRTDFYSLGVTFYELLAGRLPFESDDPMELVHCHLAKRPLSLQELTGVDLPEMLSAIVMKLMAKNPEERYQSGLGLRHDLEQCGEQWQAKGKIEKFNLGTKDLCDRFIIPEKLYGREAEVEQLLAAFERVATKDNNTELILVAGFSGIGKTAVVNEVHKPIVKQRGYFVKGKFDQFNRNIPFSALVQALRNLMGQLLSESDVKLQQWQAKIVDAVGKNGQVIIDVIPELEKIIGKQPAVSELSGSAAQNRFNLLFGKFIQVFTTKDHPLVIFLDDLQWADSASLNLLKLLMSEREQGYLLLIGAYRDNEVFLAHPLMLTLDEITKLQGKINTITLSPLSKENINYLVADTLSCSFQVAESLTELVYQKTKGNPFFTTQFLLGLNREKLINFNREAGHWECDLAQVRQQTLTDDVVEFMAGRLQKLPEKTQEVLKLAACIGNQFDLKTLAIVSEQSKEDTADSLWRALQEGFILPQSEVYKFYLEQTKNGNGIEIHEINPVVSYKFLHDRVQQAAYSLIWEEEKQLTHWKIGQLLLKESSPYEQLEQVFTLVNQLNLGKAAISNSEERQQLAYLNLQAAKKAKLSAAYQVAQDYCTIAIDLLPITAWQTDYELIYSLHRYGSEGASLCGNFDQAELLYNQALINAQNVLDKAIIYRLQMTQYQLQGRNSEAIAIQRQSLQLLGWEMPKEEEVIQANLDEEIAKVNQFLEESEVQSILNLPQMKDETIAEMLRILQILFYAAWLDGQPTLAFLAAAKMITLSLEHGNSDMSPFGYVSYGLVANAILKDITTAYEFGDMAVQLCEQFDNADVRGMTNFLFAADVHSWSRPIREGDIYYENAYRYGMEAGNWLTVGFMMMLSGSDRLTYGKNLNELYTIVQTHADFLRHIKSLENLDALIVGVRQPIRNLLGLTKTIFTFDDDDFSESEYLDKYNETPYHLAWFYSVKIRHAYLFNNHGAYPDLVSKLDIIENTISTHAKVPSSVFYVALMHLYLAENSKDEKDYDFHWKRVYILEEKLNNWQKYCPENLLHKSLLIQAEKARLNKQKTEAIDLYEQAINQARTNQYDYEEALANERAAKFYLDWGKEKIAATYIQEAYYCYARWGAKAKTDDLERCYPNLLQAIINQEKINSFTNHFSNCDQTLTLTNTNNSSTNYSSTLDFAAVIKTSQAISSEIHLNQLLCTLMSVVIENSGADKGVFISHQSGKLIIEAVVGFSSQEEIHNSSIVCQLFEPTEPIPHSLVNYVFRNGETLVIDDLSTDTKFAGDNYFQTHQPQSILCTPIFHQGKITSILYLENNFTKEAFTRDRLELLNLLCTQAAISLENARLYENLEQKVQERTRKLSDTLAELKATQKKLVESEKMAALGNLVAGVAHEINTPVGTSITVASNLAAKTQTFADSITQGKLKRSILNNYLEIAQQSSDLLVQNLHRAGELVHSFKQVAVDQSNLELRTFKVKEYIEGVLLSLAPQLKTSPHKITVSGDANLTLNSYAGCLAQVVTNLVMNSLKHAYPQDQPGELHWEILSEEKGLKIIYTDDGCGISRENLSRIFEPFFTTKRNEGGTGLGLHIVYNLITHKLGGSIEVDSQVGEGTRFSLTLPSMIF